VLRYALLPDISAQAQRASAAGHPLLRPLFFEDPDDPGSWLIDDEYLFGQDLLVAPLFAAENPPPSKGGARGGINNFSTPSPARSARPVDIPPGNWIDYQTGQTYAGATWHNIPPGEIPIILLVRSGAAIPHAAVAQSTDRLNWKNLELRVFAAPGESATAQVALPGGDLHALQLEPNGDKYSLDANPLEGQTICRITRTAK
jgi:alpha-D-xyloside xylohydrolase